MNIQEWQTRVHRLAVEKGWYDVPRTALESHMLIVSELAEASEEVRKGTPPIYQLAAPTMTFGGSIVLPSDKKDRGVIGWDETVKPEGELIELADAVIRIMDYCEAKGYNLQDAIRMKHEYNKTRKHRHGGKLL